MSNINSASIVQISVNPKGGVPKNAVSSAEIRINGVIGDKQRHRRFHGGPSRAVSLYSMERIEALQDEGHPIEPGSTGENLTICGLAWETLTVGSRLAIGAVVQLEITGYAAPCETIAGSFHDQRFTRISQKLHPGWSRLYTKVLQEGTIFVGDPVIIL